MEIYYLYEIAVTGLLEFTITIALSIKVLWEMQWGRMWPYSNHHCVPRESWRQFVALSVTSTTDSEDMQLSWGLQLLLHATSRGHNHNWQRGMFKKWKPVFYYCSCGLNNSPFISLYVFSQITMEHVYISEASLCRGFLLSFEYRGLLVKYEVFNENKVPKLVLFLPITIRRYLFYIWIQHNPSVSGILSQVWTGSSF